MKEFTLAFGDSLGSRLKRGRSQAGKSIQMFSWRDTFPATSSLLDCPLRGSPLQAFLDLLDLSHFPNILQIKCRSRLNSFDCLMLTNQRCL